VTPDELRALQAPLEDALSRGPVGGGGDAAGLHPATGGTGLSACSGDMLLEALMACAGVTLRAVATALGIAIDGGTVTAEGDLDFRGTLGVAKDAPRGLPAGSAFASTCARRRRRSSWPSCWS